jgi:hypothetical protein
VIWAALITVLAIAAITAAVTLALSRTSGHPTAHEPSKTPAARISLGSIYAVRGDLSSGIRSPHTVLRGPGQFTGGV